MNRTLAFAKLDYLTVKPYLTLKSFAILLALFVFLSIGTGGTSMMIGMLMMYGTIYATYPFAVGDKNGIDTLYATLPLKKRNIVTGRYIFALCLNLLVGAVAFALSAILMGVTGKVFDLRETLATILICFFVFGILEAVQLPIYFKLGYAKAKFLAYLPLVGFPAAVAGATALVDKDAMLPFIESLLVWLEANMLFAGALALIIWACVLTGSCLLSYRLYSKREF